MYWLMFILLEKIPHDSMININIGNPDSSLGGHLSYKCLQFDDGLFH